VRCLYQAEVFKILKIKFPFELSEHADATDKDLQRRARMHEDREVCLPKLQSFLESEEAASS
jgi:hypothetical protein